MRKIIGLFALLLVAIVMLGCFSSVTTGYRQPDGTVIETGKTSLSPFGGTIVKPSDKLQYYAESGLGDDGVAHDRAMARQRNATQWPPRGFAPYGMPPAATCNGHGTDYGECARFREGADTWNPYSGMGYGAYGGGFYSPYYGPNSLGYGPRPY